MLPGASTSQTYTVYTGDAVDGIINIIATFTHTDLGLQTIAFAYPHIDKTLGTDTNFTVAFTGQSGTGAITYTSSNPAVATVSNDGEVTIVGLGDTIISGYIAACANYAAASASYTLTVHEELQPFIAVTSIIDVPTASTAGLALTLTGVVTPSNADNQTIIWSVSDAGTTGATITGNTLNTTASGVIIVTATIIDGTAIGVNYTQSFNITIAPVDDTHDDDTSDDDTPADKTPDNNNQSGLPKTGVDSNIILWVNLLILSLMGVIVTAPIIKRIKTKKTR